MFTLLALSALSLALITLAETEPTIAVNHLRASQAHAMAESGIERAVWALTNALEPGGMGGGGTPPNVVPTGPAPAPYDGSTFLAFGRTGGARVTITGTAPAIRLVRALGWSGADAGRRTSGGAVIVATLARLRNLAFEAPCALCVAAPLALAASVIDARGSGVTNCGGKVAAWSTADVSVDDRTTRLHGADAPAGTPAAEEGRDWLRNQRAIDFALSPADLDATKALATVRGTYIKASSTAAFDLTSVPDGLVFVDSTDGANALTAANAASVTLRSGFSARTPFTGWLIVNGNVAVQPDFGGLDGVLYATGAVTALDTGTSAVKGAVIATHALGGAAALRGATLSFDCGAARGSGRLPAGWFVKPGSYCDATSGC